LLLRACRQWPRHQAAEKGDEFPPLQLIELHAPPRAKTAVQDIEIGNGQSGGIKAFTTAQASRSDLDWRQSARSRFASNCGLTKCDASTALSAE
jgi:hypothetical protein